MKFVLYSLSLFVILNGSVHVASADDDWEAPVTTSEALSVSTTSHQSQLDIALDNSSSISKECTQEIFLQEMQQNLKLERACKRAQRHHRAARGRASSKRKLVRFGRLANKTCLAFQNSLTRLDAAESACVKDSNTNTRIKARHVVIDPVAGSLSDSSKGAYLNFNENITEWQ